MIFDPTTATTDDLLARYEAVRTNRSPERDLLRQTIATRIREAKLYIAWGGIRYWLDSDGEVMRRPHRPPQKAARARIGLAAFRVRSSPRFLEIAS